jgi:hypothetical protein
MSIVLALTSNKGGVGKTTTAVTVGSYFAFRRNWRVQKVMAELVKEKSAKVIPAQGKLKVYFLGFSHSGLDIRRAGLPGRDCPSPGSRRERASTVMRLVTLDELDGNLVLGAKQSKEIATQIAMRATPKTFENYLYSV